MTSPLSSMARGAGAQSGNELSGDTLVENNIAFLSPFHPLFCLATEHSGERFFFLLNKRVCFPFPLFGKKKTWVLTPLFCNNELHVKGRFSVPLSFSIYLTFAVSQLLDANCNQQEAMLRRFNPIRRCLISKGYSFQFLFRVNMPLNIHGTGVDDDKAIFDSLLQFQIFRVLDQEKRGYTQRGSKSHCCDPPILPSDSFVGVLKWSLHCCSHVSLASSGVSMSSSFFPFS